MIPKSVQIKMLAEELFIALVANPERYNYMAMLAKDGASNEELTSKNINKAIKMAEQFYNEIEKR